MRVGGIRTRWQTLVCTPTQYLWRWLLVAKVGAHKHERNRDANPQEAERKERAEWNSLRRLLAPHQQVDDEKYEKRGAGEHHARQHRRFLPLLTLWIVVWRCNTTQRGLQNRGICINSRQQVEDAVSKPQTPTLKTLYSRAE